MLTLQKTIRSCRTAAWLQYTDTVTVDTRPVSHETALIHERVYDPISPGRPGFHQHPGGEISGGLRPGPRGWLP